MRWCKVEPSPWIKDRLSNGGRRAFSLVEVLVAAALLAAMAYYLIHALVGTARGGKRAADLFAEAVVAQCVLGQIKDSITYNLDYLGHLDSGGGFRKQSDASGDRFTIFGTLVKTASPPTTPLGRPAQLPFFARLLPDASATPAPAQVQALVQGGGGGGGAGATAAASAPALTDAQLADLGAALVDFAVTVTISNGARPMDFDGVMYGDRNLRELIKRVKVDVYRLSECSTSNAWAPAYTTSIRVLTPIESLSQDAVFDLADSSRLADARPIIAEAIRQLKQRPSLAGFDDGALEMAAQLYLVFQEVNAESFIVEGKPIVPMPGVPQDVQGLDQQIAALQGTRSGFLQRRLGFLLERKALTIFQTFKRVALFLSDLGRKEDDMRTEILASRAPVDQFLSRAKVLMRGPGAFATAAQLPDIAGELTSVASGYEQYLDTSKSLVARARLMEYLLTDPQFVAVRNRLAKYPDRMVQALDAASQVFGRLADGGSPSVLTEAKSASDWLDTSKAFRIVTSGASLDQPTTDRLTSLGARFMQSLPPLADDLQQTTLRAPLETLKLRYPALVEAIPVFQTLAGPGNPMFKIQQDYGNSRPVSDYLNVLGAVPSGLYGGAWNLAWAEGRLGVPQGQFDSIIRAVDELLQKAITAAIAQGLTATEVIRAFAMPDAGDRRQIASFGADVNASLQGQGTPPVVTAPPTGAGPPAGSPPVGPPAWLPPVPSVPPGAVTSVGGEFTGVSTSPATYTGGLPGANGNPGANTGPPLSLPGSGGVPPIGAPGSLGPGNDGIPAPRRGTGNPGPGKGLGLPTQGGGGD